MDVEDHGRKYIAVVPDNAPDSHAEWGVRLGPPDLDALDLPAALADRLHAELFNRRLITKADVLMRPDEVSRALMAALKLDALAILALYD